MTGLVIKLELITAIPPILRIEVNADYSETLKYSLGRIIEFVTKEKVNIVTFGDGNEYNPFPQIDEKYSMGVCIFTIFDTQTEALAFIKRFKEDSQ